MITCVVQYEIDPSKQSFFETYAQMWLNLLPKLGGVHHGYFMPYEGANDKAMALFSFSSLAAYEAYRHQLKTNPEAIEAFEFANTHQMIKRYDRTFMEPKLVS